MTMKETVCPMIGQVCRFASEIKIPVVNRTVDLKKKVIRKETTYDNKGVFCNNDGKHYVKDLKGCPKVDAFGVPMVPYVVSELDWSRRRDSGTE